MWVPTWIVDGWPIYLFVGWVLKIWFRDVPADKRRQVERARREKEERETYWKNVEKADRMLEKLVEKGAPVCLLWDRKHSDREISVPCEPTCSLMFLHESYQTYHEARKLQQESQSPGATSADNVAVSGAFAESVE